MAGDWFRPAAVALVDALAMLALGLAAPLPLPILGAAIVVAAILSSISPLGGLGATVLTLPYFYHPVGAEGTAFAPSEVLLFATAAGAAGRVILNLLVAPSLTKDWLRGRIASLVRSPLLIAATSIAVLGAITLLHLYDPAGRAASLREWRWTLLEPMLLVALLLTVADQGPDRHFIVGCFLAGGLVAALHGLADPFTGGGVTVGAIRRLDGPFPHPNAFALYLLRPTVLGISLIVLFRKFRLVWIAPAAVGSIALVGAFSRAALVGLVVAVAILAWRMRARARLALAATAVVGAAVLLIIAGDRMMSTFSGGSLSLRLHIWESALRMIRDRPVLGYGPDQFLYAYSPRYIAPEAWGERFTSHAHNLVIDFWIRLGIIGAVFAAGTVIYIARTFASHISRGLTGSVVETAAIITLVAAIIQGMVDNGYFVHDLAMSGWLLAWLAFGRPRSSQSEGNRYRARPGSWWGGSGGLASVRQSDR